MPAGTLFSSDDPDLAVHVRTLEDRIARLFPEFADGRAAARLRLAPDQLTGRGVALAAGYLPPANTALALYYGHVARGGRVAFWRVCPGPSPLSRGRALLAPIHRRSRYMPDAEPPRLQCGAFQSQVS